jgi:Domain of unknown function (DUF222)
MFVTLESIAKLRKELDAAEAAWLKEVAAYDRSYDWRAEGFMNPASALRHACHMSQGVARGHLELARKLEDLPEVAAAFADGEISARHATAIAVSFTPERVSGISEVETALVEYAREATPHDLGRVVKYVTDAIDGDGGAVAEEARYQRRRLHMSRTLDGAPTRPRTSCGCTSTAVKAGNRTVSGRMSATCSTPRTVSTRRPTWSPAPPRPRPRRSGKPSSYATSTANTPAATDPRATARRTTSGTGPATAPPTSTIWSCSAGTTTANATAKTPWPAHPAPQLARRGRERREDNPYRQNVWNVLSRASDDQSTRVTVRRRAFCARGRRRSLVPRWNVYGSVGV